MEPKLTGSSKEFQALIVRFEQMLRERMLAAYDSGRPLPELEREVFVALRAENLSGKLQRALERHLRLSRRTTVEELRARFVDARTPTGPIAGIDMIAQTLAGYTRLETAIEGRVIDVIRRGFTEGMSRADIGNVIEHQIGIEGTRVRTLTRTGVASVGRQANLEVGIASGLTHMRYAGPSTQRETCSEWMRMSRDGHLWTVDEIKRLDNGQGLPVLTSGGGFNCVHRWVWAVPRRQPITG